MNFKPILDDDGSRIVKTGAAVGPGVFGELGMARAALAKLVDHEISMLRQFRDAALRTREADLLSEDAPEPGIDIPPAPSEADPQADDPLPDAPGRDDLTDIPAFMRRS